MKAGLFASVFLLIPVFGVQAVSAQSRGSGSGDVTAPELVVQTGHSVPVHWTRFTPAVAWSVLGFPGRPGIGEIIATGSNDGTVKIWDTQELREARVLRLGNGASIGAMAVSSDGARVAAAGGDLAKVWEIGTGREVVTARLSAASGHTQDAITARSVAFNQDGTRLAIGDDQHAEVWEIDRSGGPLFVSNPAQKMAFGPDDILAVAGHDPIPPGKSIDLSIPYHIAAWDARKGSFIDSYAGVGYFVFAIAVNGDGSILGWGGGNCIPNQTCSSTVRRIARDGSVRDSNGPALYPTGGTICPGAGTLAAGTADGHIMLWDIAAQRSVYQGMTDKSFIEDVSCSYDGQRLVSGEMRGRVGNMGQEEALADRRAERFRQRDRRFRGGSVRPASSCSSVSGRISNTGSSLKAPEYLASSSAPIAESKDGGWVAVGKDKKKVVLLGDKRQVIDTGVSAPGAAVAFD
jgi:WD40 repeat protein